MFCTFVSLFIYGKGGVVVSNATLCCSKMFLIYNCVLIYTGLFPHVS